MVYRGTLDNWKGYFHHVVAVKTLKGNIRSILRQVKFKYRYFRTL